jgi:suppressor for copper-sensitivity B
MIIQVVRNILLLFALSLSTNSFADEILIAQEDNGRLVVNLKLDEGSVIYWNKYTKIGLATKLDLINSSNIKSYNVDWPWPKFKPEGKVIAAIFDGDVRIPVYITPTNPSIEASFDVKLTYLLCNDLGCFPKEKIIRSSINSYQSFSKASVDNNRKILYSNNRIYVEAAKSEKSEAIIIFKGMVHLPEFIEKIDNNDFYAFHIKNINNESEFEVVHSDIKESKVIKFSEIKPLSPSMEKIIFFSLYALLGGFILNLMPCVLPVLSLKLYSLVNSKTTTERRVEAILSILTIIAFFTSLGLVTSKAKQVGEFFIPGFNLQIPSVLILCMIVVTITVSLMREKISLNIPISCFSSNSKYLNVILTTLVSTILATPCTAPFLATSMTFAMSQTSEIILLMFFLSSIGFATPYFGVLINPNILSFLPKSGVWQQKLKTFFLGLLILTVVWLFWVLSVQLGYFASITVLLMLYFIRVIIESDFRFILKLFTFAVIIVLSFSLPANISRNFHKFEETLENSWEKFSPSKLEEYIKNGDTVFIYATAEWCVTCQVNKVMVLDRPDTLLMFRKYKVKLLKIDLTNQNEEGNNFLMKYNSPGIPFAIALKKENASGIILPVLFKYSDLENAIKKVLKNDK